jgi:hypothetical protein
MILTRKSVTLFAEVVSFAVASFTLYSLLNYYIFENTSLFFTNAYIVLFQCSYDIFLWHSNESVIHHIFAICIISFIVFNEVTNEDLITFIPLFSTEISTIFLTIKTFMTELDLSHTPLFYINMILFAITFIITRIFFFYNGIIINPKTYAIIESYGKEYQAIYFGIFGLFALNIYWAVIIIKIALKPLFKDMKRLFISEVFLCFVHFTNIIILFVTKSSSSLDWFGNILSAFSFFLLHWTIINNSDDDNFRIISDESVFYIFNQICVKIKSILFLFSLGTMFGHVSILYHFVFSTFTLFIMLNNANFYFTGRHLVWILLSFYGLGCVFMNNPFFLDGTLFILFSLILFIIDYIFKSIDLFYITESETIMLPLLLDTVLVFCYTEDFYQKISLSLIPYLMVVIYYVKPFHKNNLVLIYSCSVFYTYLLCKINSN